MSNYSKCPACRKWVPKGDSECPHCGATQGIEAWIAAFRTTLFPKPAQRKSGGLCVACNRLVGIDDQVCPYCGIKQTELRRFAKSLASVLPERVTGTHGILGVIGVLFLLPLLTGFTGEDATFGSYIVSGDGATAKRLGSLYGPDVARGDWWRFVTAGYLHFGAMHIIFNGMGLLYVGRICEDLYGRGWFLFIYVLTGVAAFVVSYYGHAGATNSAGASGPLFGLIGLGIGYSLQHRFANREILRTLVMWTLLSVVIGATMRVDNWAHFGGFVAGFICAFVLPPELVARGRASIRVGEILGAGGVLLVAASFGMGMMQAAKFG